MHSGILHAWRENECNSIKKLVKMKKLADVIEKREARLSCFSD